MVRAVVLIGGAIALFACANSAIDDVSASSAAEETTQALGTTGLAKGVYVLDDGPAAPRGETLRALEVQDAAHARVVFSYPGGASRVEGACVATASVKGTDAKTLALRCSASPFDFKIVDVGAHALALENGKGERFTLRPIDEAARGGVRARCEANGFAATIDVRGTGAARRALVHVEPNAANAQALITPPKETFVLTGDRKLVGRDLVADEYDLTLPAELPSAPGAHFEAELGFVNVMTPFELHRAAHALACDVQTNP